MMKRVVIISISGLLSLALIFTYLHFSNLKHFNNNIYKTIPSDAVAVLHINSLAQVNQLLNDKAQYSEDLNQFGWYRSFATLLQTTDSVVNSENRAINILWKNKLTISFHKEGIDYLKPLFIYSLQNKAEENTIKKYFSDYLPNSWSLKERRYNSNDIFELSIPGKKEMYFCFLSGFVVGSTSNILIENAIRQLYSDYTLLEIPSFSEVLKTAGQGNDANLFINIEQFPEVVQNIFPEKYAGKIHSIANVGKWAELDVNLKSDKILLNGFIHPGNDDDKFNQIFEGISTRSVRITRTIPTNASFILSYGVSDANKLRKNLHTYLQNNNQKTTYSRKFSNEQDEVQIFNLINNEFALVNINANQLNKQEGKVLIVQTQGNSKAQATLENMFNHPLKKAGVYQLDKETRVNIYSNEKIKEMTNVFTQFFPYAPLKYFALHDNYLFFADTQASLNKILYANILKKTLYYNKAYESFLENFSTKEHMFLYVDIAKLNEQFSETVAWDLINPNDEQHQALSHFYGGGIQLSATNQMLYANIALSYAPEQTYEPQTVWQSKLDTTIRNKPSFVVNHYSKSKEIMVQDYNNKLYLLTPNGRILWEKQLSNPILSEIFQIDFYRNNKLQYLFNTKDRIYLIDRNGNYVENYPINLPNAASNGMALFDYDNNRKYRIFVACSNKKTYVYNIKGNRVQGWKAENSEGHMQQPMQHFRIANKDYIVCGDDLRNYVLDRRGNIRVKIKNDFVKNQNSIFYEVNQKLVTTDTQGNLKTISLQTGEVSTINLLNEEIPHYFTTYQSASGINYVLVTQNKVISYATNGKKQFEIKVDGDLALCADIYQFSASNQKIGVYDQLNHKIYLINNNGKIYKNFPLKGSSRFSIGFLTQNKTNFNLVVGGENSYLYNYTVQ